MKLLQVITSLRLGGAEKLLVDMLPFYQEKGIEVDVLLFDGKNTPLKEIVEKQGVRIFCFSDGRTVYNPLYLFRLIPFLKRYDVIHTHNSVCQYGVALAKCLSRSKVKLVTTEHNTTNRRRNISCFYPMDYFIYKYYDRIISVSDATTYLLKSYLGKEFPIVTILNGIHVDIFRIASPIDRIQLNISTDNKVVVMVAGFRKQKDQDTLIRAFSYLPADYILCLVGDGEQRSDCQQLAGKLGLENRVVFTGIRTDVPAILKMADVVVMSSHWEGLSLSSIEGMAAGKPFVASDVDGLREITKDAGILFPHQNAKALADVIRRLMEDPVYYQRIAEQCLKRASEYDIRKTAEAYMEVYRLILS